MQEHPLHWRERREVLVRSTRRGRGGVEAAGGKELSCAEAPGLCPARTAAGGLGARNMFDHRMNKVSIGQDLSTKKLPVSKKYENVKAVTKTGKIVTKAAENWDELNLNVRYRKNEHFRRIRADTLVSLLHAEDDEVGLEAERTKPPRDFVPWRLATLVLTSSRFFFFLSCTPCGPTLRPRSKLARTLRRFCCWTSGLSRSTRAATSGARSAFLSRCSPGQ